MLDERTVGGRDYKTRWNALYDAIHIISGINYWQETTSFIVFTTEKTLDEVASIAKSAVSSAYDLVLIRSLDVKDARIFGPVTDNDIFQLMPYLKKG